MIRKMLMAAAVLVATCPAASAGTGTAEFFAQINAAGGIVSGSGVSSSNRFATGGYQVFFPRNVDTCVFVATPFSGFAHKATAFVTASQKTRVVVQIFINAATKQNNGFSLLVKCQD